MEDIIKIAKFLDDSGLSLDGVSETIENEAKAQKGGFLKMLLGTLDATLLGNILAGKGIVRTGYGSTREGILRPDSGSNESSLKNFFDFTTSFNKR